MSFSRGKLRLRRTLLVELLEDRTLLNATPVLSLPQTTFTDVKTAALSVLISATDKVPGQILSFGLWGARGGASISSQQQPSASGSAATVLLPWPPSEDQGPASYSFTITVTDNGHPVRSASQAVTVNTVAV